MVTHVKYDVAWPLLQGALSTSAVQGVQHFCPVCTSACPPKPQETPTYSLLYNTYTCKDPAMIVAAPCHAAAECIHYSATAVRRAVQLPHPCPPATPWP